MDTLSQSVRSSAVAGSFYPSTSGELYVFITDFELAERERIKHLITSLSEKRICGLIVPHAGWVYSGKTALFAYKLLELIRPPKIALLGPSHQFPINRVMADGHAFWETPIGNIKITSDHFFESNDTYHASEHSLEVQTPFIKYFSHNSEILPLVVGNIDTDEAIRCARHLFFHDYFLLISTDLSHFNPLAEAEEIDNKSIRCIENLKMEGVDACGINPLRVAKEYCKLKNTSPRLIDYSTSADAIGNESRVVGYASFWL